MNQNSGSVSITPYVSGYVDKKDGIDGEDEEDIVDVVEEFGESAFKIGKKVGGELGNNVEEFYTGWRKFVFKDNF